MKLINETAFQREFEAPLLGNDDCTTAVALALAAPAIHQVLDRVANDDPVNWWLVVPSAVLGGIVAGSRRTFVEYRGVDYDVDGEDF